MRASVQQLESAASRRGSPEVGERVELGPCAQAVQDHVARGNVRGAVQAYVREGALGCL